MNATIQKPGLPLLTPSWSRQVLAIACLGMVGLFGLWLQPIPVEVLKTLPTSTELAPWMIKTLLLINPLLLLLVAAALGSALAHRVGLGSVLAGTAPAHCLGCQLVWAGLGGILLGAALGVLDRFMLPWLPDAWVQLTKDRLSNRAGLVASVLYGGLSEEIVMRWGLMTLLAWLLIKWFGMPLRVALPVAIALCALAFGAAHLPVLAVHMEPTAALVARTLFINGLAGAVYGWLYWRLNLEAAMAAHAASHVGMFAAQQLLLG